MAVYRNGSKGEGVKKLQKALSEAGHDPGPFDGIFGPLTEAAVRAYEKAQGWKVDGAAGTRMLESLGLSTDGGGDDPTDYTSNENTRFNGLPGQPEIWHNSDTDTWTVVYFAPGTEPPVPVMFTVSDQDDLKSFFGDKDVKADRTLTSEQMNSTGAVVFGSTDTIPEKDGDMWAGFTERMERAKKTQPWLNDDEVFAVFAGAWIEGRQPERWELEATAWWQDHNEAQREWMWIAARDPSQAKELYEANYIAVFNQMKSLGFTDVSDGLLEYMATEFTHGNWNRAYLEMQTLALAGQDTPDGLDRGLRRYMRNEGNRPDAPNNQEEQVRDMFNTWLGPGYPASEKQIQEWAARFRDNGEEARTDLTQQLRQQRVALFPEYINENLTYEDIASPWRGFMSNAWGETPNETSGVFQKLIKMNDAVEGAKLLRQKGIDQGNSQVRRDMLEGLYETVGGPRNPV